MQNHQSKYTPNYRKYEHRRVSSINSYQSKNKENFNPNNNQNTIYEPVDIESPRKTKKYSFYSKFQNYGGDRAVLNNFDSFKRKEYQSKKVEEAEIGKNEGVHFELFEKVYGTFKKEIEFLEIRIEGFIRNKERQMRVLQVNLEVLAQKVRERIQKNEGNLDIFEEIENQKNNLLEELNGLKDTNLKLNSKIDKNGEIFKFKGKKNYLF